MGLFQFLVIVQGTIAFGLVVTILMQRSEGGGLGVGGSPSGLMSARGAADFMTRLTSALAVLFIVLSVALAFVAAKQSSGVTVDDSFERTVIDGATTESDAEDGSEAAPNSDAPADITPVTPGAQSPVIDDPLAAAAAAAASESEDETEE